MRDLLPIAFFEHLQIANWRSGRPVLSAFDICDKVAPVRQTLGASATSIDELLSPEFIDGLAQELCSRLEGSEPRKFDNHDDWQRFIGELTIECELDEQEFSEAGAYIISQLFSSHLTSFRLLTSWLVVDALGQKLGQPSFGISQEGLGRLVEHLSVGGPPVYDVEGMRGNFPDYYR